MTKVIIKKIRIKSVIKPLVISIGILWLITSITNVVTSSFADILFLSPNAMVGNSSNLVLDALSSFEIWKVLFNTLLLRLIINSIYFVVVFLLLIALIAIYNNFPRIMGRITIDVENTPKDGFELKEAKQQ